MRNNQVRESNGGNFHLFEIIGGVCTIQRSMLALRVHRRMDAPIVLSDIQHEVDLLCHLYGRIAALSLRRCC